MSTTDPLMNALGRAAPEVPWTAQDEALRQRALADVFEQIDREGARRLPRWPRVTLRPVRIAALASAVAAVATIVVISLGDQSAESVLGNLAAKAAQTPVLPAPVRERAELAYLAGDNSRQGSFHYLALQERETTVREDHSAEVVTKTTGALFEGPDDRRDWERAGSPEIGTGGTNRLTFAPGTWPDAVDPTVGPTIDLPTSRALLEPIIDRAAKRSGSAPPEVRTFEIVGDILAQPGVDPRVRSALFEIARDLPSVILVGERKDALGRPGIEIAIDSDYSGVRERDSILFDQANSAVLEQSGHYLEDAPDVDGNLAYYELENVPADRIPGEGVIPGEVPIR